MNPLEESTILRVKDLHLAYPNGNGGLHALQDVNFSLAREEFVAVLGPSGSGKTTLLRLLAGLLQPTHGKIQFFGLEPGCLPCVGLVFQQANLMPWRNVLENILLPLELDGVDHQEAVDAAQSLIELVGLQGFEQAWSRDLSGGMAQRVALARALIQKPDLLLLDEPFGSLDALTREKMGAELLRVWEATCNTVVMVTHSISEALLLSDRVLVLSSRPGHILLDLKVELPRPRLEDMRYTPAFGEQARLLKSAIEG
ncbi:MAG: ABC transporter ATP-binding protein [Anaerolineaceae bacterium]